MGQVGGAARKRKERVSCEETRAVLPVRVISTGGGACSATQNYRNKLLEQRARHRNRM